VLLTAKEHFVAHQLLCKIHPECFGLLYAVDRMSRQHKVSSRQYSWLKEKYAKKMSLKQTGKTYSDEVNAKKGSPGELNGMYGKQHSEETKKRMSEAKKLLTKEKHPHFGKTSPLKGKTYEEIMGSEKAKILKKNKSDSLKGIKRPYNEGANNPACRDEVRKKISDARSVSVYIDNIEYKNIKVAMSELGLSRYKVKKLIKK
jgi:hypothetical protein